VKWIVQAARGQSDSDLLEVLDLPYGGTLAITSAPGRASSTNDFVIGTALEESKSTLCNAVTVHRIHICASTACQVLQLLAWSALHKANGGLDKLAGVVAAAHPTRRHHEPASRLRAASTIAALLSLSGPFIYLVDSTLGLVTYEQQIRRVVTRC